MDYWFIILVLLLLLIVGYTIITLYLDNKHHIETVVYKAEEVKQKSKKDEPINTLNSFYPEPLTTVLPNDTPASFCPNPRAEKHDIPLVSACPQFIETSSNITLFS